MAKVLLQRRIADGLVTGVYLEKLVSIDLPQNMTILTHICINKETVPIRFMIYDIDRQRTVFLLMQDNEIYNSKLGTAHSNETLQSLIDKYKNNGWSTSKITYTEYF